MFTALLTLQLALTAFVVKDGDTLRDTGRGYDIRIYGIDTPEIGLAKCEAERALGEVVAARVRELLGAGQVVTYAKAYTPRDARKWPVDGFKRRLATISIDGEDLGTTLLAEGLAKPYKTGPHPDWCTQP